MEFLVLKMTFPKSSFNLYALFFRLCRILNGPSQLGVSFPSDKGF